MPSISKNKSVSSALHREVSFLDLFAILEPDWPLYQQAFERVVKNTAFIRGAECARFEEAFAEWALAGSQVLGCANGTDALRLAIRALGLKPGDEAIVPAMTFFATIEPLVELGLVPRLVDVEPGTWLLDVQKLESAVGPKTKLIVPVHLYGQSPQMDRIREIADSHNCFVLEDAAQAQGALWREKPVGYWGDVATFSFFPGKNLGAFGDAGALLSKNADIVARARALSNHGGAQKYQHDEFGYNSRLDNLQAAFLNIKLNRIDEWNAKRRQVALWYSQYLADIPYLSLPVENINAQSVYHLYVVLVEDRGKFQQFLSARGVQTGVHYPKAIHHQPAVLRHFGDLGSFPNAEKVAAHGVSLPMGPTLTEEDIFYVSEVIREYYGVK
ncbi:MAG: DegT/DnrJ/EryC1/StrS family aminotransferase [Bdellovibrionaceae bacterium]|nr:DegT/DnrJ/EryC1/StrS family aminotransferase [Bdellovibrionales bacterium]MCB9254622.1 DegT/DnrJ/EryC1/StrS family aminotransferase [Pseudobdellovibrionaceae bacterium]